MLDDVLPRDRGDEPPRRTVPTSRTRLIYIAGAGRSGSTLLANALGSLPGALSAGEVKLAFRRGLAEDGTCGCREPVRACPVWSAAFEDALGRVPSQAEARALDARLSAAVRTRRLAWWIAGRTSDEVDDLVHIVGQLVVSLAKVSGANAVIDSSKLSPYGALLARSPRLDVRTVHLVRDPRAVAWSWQRRAASQQVSGFEEEMERFTGVKSSLLWLESSASVPALGRRTGARPLVVRYEDFTADPRGELARIAAFAGLPSDPSPVRADGLHLRPSHAVAGNPNRVRAGAVPIRRDDEWRTAMPVRSRRLVSGMTAVSRGRYGY